MSRARSPCRINPTCIENGKRVGTVATLHRQPLHIWRAIDILPRNTPQRSRCGLNETSVRELKDIVAELRCLEPELRQRYPIRQMGVFGSYARGTQHAGSDLDLLVDFDAPIGLMELVGLKNDISDAVKLDVDLVMKDCLKPRIGRRILSEVVML